MKNRLIALLVLFTVTFFVSSAQAQTTARKFEAGKNTFLLDGKPFVVKAAELHYTRIPQAYWEHRIEMCKALGMNTICIYIFWNIHEQEEGKFDFTGQNDIAAFCRAAQKHGMYVIVRPGPYVCAEWEMGGLPWWLLKKKDIALRTLDPYYMERVGIFMKEVGKQLAPLQVNKGGNIIMVQVENEYGSYGINKPYVSAVRDLVRESGFTDVPLFQCDWSSNFTNNALDDLIWTVNFGTGANIDQQFKKLKELRPETPLMCSEFWSGWFDHWGRKHETRPAKDMVQGIKDMLDRKISFGLLSTTRFYMPRVWTEGMLSANFRPCRWFNATVTGSATNYGLGWGWLLNFTPKGVTLFFGSDYMVTRVTPQWIPTGRATASFNLGMNIPIGRRHDLDFQPVYYR